MHVLEIKNKNKTVIQLHILRYSKTTALTANLIELGDVALKVISFD